MLNRLLPLHDICVNISTIFHKKHTIKINNNLFPEKPYE